MARVPTLQTKDPLTKVVTDTARDNEHKAELFHSLFFPPKPAVSSAPTDAAYQDAKWEHEPVTNEQIDRAIRRLKPKKSTMTDTIPNCVFRQAREVLVPFLGPLYRATDELAWYPDD
jgi:hypothetical protein